MPAVSVVHCKREFLVVHAGVSAFVAEIPSYRLESTPGAQAVRLGARRTESLIGLALLRLQLAWESLVEETYHRYLCGATSPDGQHPQLLQPREPDISSARGTVLGSQSYISWAQQPTTQRARTHFQNGEPYATSIGGAASVLQDMAVVRNRLAHSGDYAANRFANVLRSNIGYVPRGMTPGRFLLTPIGYPQLTTGARYIDRYLAVVRVAGEALVP